MPGACATASGPLPRCRQRWPDSNYVHTEPLRPTCAANRLMLDLRSRTPFSALYNYDFEINGDSVRKFLLITAGLSLLAAAAIKIWDASAKWGCYAKKRTDGWGGSYGQDSKERAVELAIRSNHKKFAHRIPVNVKVIIIQCRKRCSASQVEH